MRQITIISVLSLVFLTSCATSHNRTREVSEGYRIYDITGTANHSQIVAKLKMAVQKYTDKAFFTNNIPPHPLPQQAGRFQLTSPFSKSGLGALIAAQGGAKVPKCDNAIFTAFANDRFEGSERTTFFVCLLPYKAGYHMDIYYTFTKSSGGFSARALGQALARSVVGDSSQFIPRMLTALETAAQDAGGNVKLLESYP